MSNEKTKRKFSLGLFYSKFGIFLILAAVFIIAAIAVPNFASKRNLMNILIAISCTTVLAFGATFIIILGHINIAYGSQIAFIGCAAVLVNVATGSVWAAIPVALVLGLFFGGLSGFFITKFNTPAFIMTLALTEACRGGAVLITGGTTVQGMTPDFAFVGQGYVGPIPMSIIIMAICFAIMWVILNKTVFGRHVYAVGGNANAAKASGIKPQRVVMKAFLLDGLMVGVASMLLMGRLNAGVPAAGVSYEMDAITAVVVGGTSMSGGSGTLRGTLVGAIIVGIINNVQTLLGVDGNVQKIVKGAIIVGAVVIDVITKNSAKKVR
ncbi:ABC transporter permease [Intestinibacillus massiliensis]|nr:ABC transporter permease [Intestinibacillus massiliensis]